MSDASIPFLMPTFYAEHPVTEICCRIQRNIEYFFVFWLCPRDPA